MMGTKIVAWRDNSISNRDLVRLDKLRSGDLRARARDTELCPTSNWHRWLECLTYTFLEGVCTMARFNERELAAS